MEQRLINANEIIKYARKWTEHPNSYISQRNKDFIYYLETADTVFTIPENPTNGDMIKALHLLSLGEIFRNPMKARQKNENNR